MPPRRGLHKWEVKGAAGQGGINAGRSRRSCLGRAQLRVAQSKETRRTPDEPRTPPEDSEDLLLEQEQKNHVVPQLPQQELKQGQKNDVVPQMPQRELAEVEEAVDAKAPPLPPYTNRSSSRHKNPINLAPGEKSEPHIINSVSARDGPINDENQHSNSAVSNVASLTQRLDNLDLQLGELSKRTETLEDKIDNETNPTVAERLETRLKNYYSREEDLRAEKRRTQAQIDRLLSHAAQLPTPTGTPPKSVSTQPSAPAGGASGAGDPSRLTSPNPPARDISRDISKDLPAETTAKPPKSVSTPTATPSKSASTSSSGSAASTVNPTDLERLYEKGRALDPAFGEEKSRNDGAAFECYHEAAIAGHPACQNGVGDKLQLGLGVVKNATKAVEWYQKAADQGNPDGQFNLGLGYEHGVGVGKDLKMAVHWYEKAAEQGHAAAQNELGTCYQHGVGVGKNEWKAMEWYKKAAEQGHSFGQYNLGSCYLNGFGVDKNETKAVEWLKKAAEQGDAKAQNYLGECYDDGIGIEEDERRAYYGKESFPFAENKTEAVEWFEKALKQGHAEAQNMLGVCYQKGDGVGKDKRKAVELFKLAAEQGDADGQYNLGMCYFNGKGVAQDLTMGKEWLKKAAAQGQSGAKNALVVTKIAKWGSKAVEAWILK
ncbi:hypothetical protein HK104_006241 [Borealophlyctis nickersoniae]|nr:hypothetical protein HK104_006241 [Borealophlyctis nickersoniae]